MSDQAITLTLSRADADWLHGWLLNAPLECWEATKAPERICAAINASLDAAPAEGPERAATGETLEALIAECERRDWEWRIERVLVEDGPDSSVFTRIASVKPLAWQGERFDETDEDGWFGLSDTDADGSMTDLLRETMQWATGVPARHNRANGVLRAAGEERGA